MSTALTLIDAPTVQDIRPLFTMHLFGDPKAPEGERGTKVCSINCPFTGTLYTVDEHGEESFVASTKYHWADSYTTRDQAVVGICRQILAHVGMRRINRMAINQMIIARQRSDYVITCPLDGTPYTIFHDLETGEIITPDIGVQFDMNSLSDARLHIVDFIIAKMLRLRRSMNAVDEVIASCLRTENYGGL